jgi:hypothetical protein
MNIDFIDELIIPIITAGCLCIGFVLKKWMPADDKWIPTILGILGAVSGIVLFGLNYEGVVKGMISGLAAIGLHQAFYQHIKSRYTDEMTDEEAFAAMEEDEDIFNEVVDLSLEEAEEEGGEDNE